MYGFGPTVAQAMWTFVCVPGKTLTSLTAKRPAIRHDITSQFPHRALQAPNVTKTGRYVVSRHVVESLHKVEEHIPRVKKEMSAATSKAFRAKLLLTEHDARRLQMWAADNCAMSTLFVGPRNATIMICLKDRSRSAASFARSIRSVLNAMAIPTSCIAGHWVTLISEEECLKLCHTSTTSMSTANHHGDQRPRTKSTDADSKTVLLPR